VKGQHIAKRAALIAAAGFHNFMMEGSPGCGKSMIAKRLLYILPPSSLQEMIENVKHQSLNKQSVAYTPLRPFRNPHQSASKSSILGSATQFEAKPGEIALAHNGILFFDELPHFKKDILESLREPLENNKLVVSRVHSKLEYDTSFLFVAALNPCPCGNLLSKSKECRCQEREINAYRTRISEPLLDRIDLFVQMSEYEEDALLSPINLDSAHMQKMVFDAFALQKSRGQTIFNGKLDEREIALFCMLNDECEALLQQASERFSLSYRAQNKVKKVARTIADVANETHIQKPHILEALSYRRI
ncbi:ATP-binding protein, partial [Helicobacter japonicus]|uniref:ATP-binding protein n=1 Tax=Helicobacter japonicus TaxID=425400 RepID=UPI003013D57A